MTARGSWLTLEPGTPSPAHVLSKTSALLLVNKSPLHANLRKTRQYEEESTEDMETGTIAHAMLLGKGKPTTVLDFPDYKTKAAQTAKKEAYARGEIPILAAKEPKLRANVERVRLNLSKMGYDFDGVSEAGVSWFETTTDGEDVECWGALDHWRERRRTILDLKFLRSAHVDACRRHIWFFGGDIQAAAYTSAVEKIHPELTGRITFVLLFAELASGAVTPVPIKGGFEALGQMRWQRAVDTWARCLRDGTWPAYVDEPTEIEPADWMITAELMAQSSYADRLSRLAPSCEEEEIDNGETD